MSSTINTNINSLTAQRNLGMNQASLATSMQRLSSGLRINSAKDDAAGLAIADRMTSQIRGLTQAARNANDGISLSQVAEGALGSAGSILQRVRELSVQSANATNSAADRKSLQAETGQLLAELDRIATTTQFNGQNILDGSLSSATFQVGANANQTITATTSNFRTNIYGVQLAQSSVAIVALSPAPAPSIDLTGDILINGAQSKTIPLVNGDSAATAAASINGVSDATGVTANARTVAEFKVTVAPGAYALAVTSSNAHAANITFGASATGTSAGLAEAVKAFNDVASQTGITARMNAAGDGLVLTNDSGDDIKIVNNSTAANNITVASFDGPAAAIAGADRFTAAATTAGGGVDVSLHGTLEFQSEKGFSFGTPAGTASALVTPATASSLSAVNTVDISTVTGATKALKIVDAALATVNGQRASFGALQSRFEAAISNMQIATENLSASRSRIQDADFAQETANLSRSQILQQAGTAMVAQANSIPQGVLALLK
jgi:flagellin